MNRYCYNCGVELQPGASNCHECGVRLLNSAFSSKRTLNLSITTKRNVTLGFAVLINYVLLISSAFNGYYPIESINTWQFIVSFFYSIALLVYTFTVLILTNTEFQSGNATVMEKLTTNILVGVSLLAYFLILSAFIVGL